MLTFRSASISSRFSYLPPGQIRRAGEYCVTLGMGPPSPHKCSASNGAAIHQAPASPALHACELARMGGGSGWGCPPGRPLTRPLRACLALRPVLLVDTQLQTVAAARF